MQENLTLAPIRPTFYKYLLAAFGSSLISCIYGMVDTAVVGHAVGPMGSATLAVVMPIWTIMYSLGLLVGIGGTVSYSFNKGQGKMEKANAYFTLSVVLCVFLGVVCWIVMIGFENGLLRFFGADETLLELAKAYMMPVLWVIPFFPFTQMLAAFLRNDNVPQLATIAVLTGGVFNIIGDFLFVFGLDMGLFGAGLATAMGTVLSVMVMSSHFISKKNTLRFVRVFGIGHKIKVLLNYGMPSFLSDVGMGVVVTLFNRSVMLYFDADALAVYGVLAQMTTVVQATSYGIGQASQPLVSINYGARLTERVVAVKRYAFSTATAFGALWLLLFLIEPNMFIYLFMAPTENVLAIAPAILRTFGFSFAFVPVNIVAMYYFQSIMKAKEALFVSMTRGFVLPSIFVFVLPMFFGATSIWWVMPITEILALAYVASCLRKQTL